MAFASVSEWDVDAADNTEIDGISLAENVMRPPAVNNAFREMMSQIASYTRHGSDLSNSTGTLNLDSIDAMFLNITGTTTVTAATLTEGHSRRARAVSAFQLTASASLVVNGSTSSNYTTSAGDLLFFEGYGSSVVRVWSAGATSAATTGAAGIVELATLAETLAYTDATRAVTPSNLPLPTGYLYGLTLANGTDATNDINIAAGSARDASDSYNFLLGSTYVKQIDAAWALGSAAGGLDTGSVGNDRYAIWGIGRSDTRVCDVLFSTSFSSPTMPANYDFKVLIGEFTRTGGVNGTPLWYGPRRAATGYAGITLGSPTASTSGTSIDFTGIPPWAKRVHVGLAGVSTNGSSILLVQVGDSGGVEDTGYSATCFNQAGTVTNATAGFNLSTSQAAATVVHGQLILSLMDAANNTWACLWNTNRSDSANAFTGSGSKSLSAVLDRIRVTPTNGTDTFDAGLINISYE